MYCNFQEEGCNFSILKIGFLGRVATIDWQFSTFKTDYN